MIKQSWKLMVILQTLYALITLTLFQFIITISNTYNNICSVWKLRVSRISCARVGQFDITYKNDLTILVVLKFSSFEMSHWQNHFSSLIFTFQMKYAVKYVKQKSSVRCSYIVLFQITVWIYERCWRSMVRI